MATLLDFDAVQPRSRFNRAASVRIPASPSRLRLAAVRIVIPPKSSNNRVEVIATVGVRGITGISQVLFRVFRNGVQIFNTVQGIESTGSEQNYVVTFQAVNINVPAGSQTYVVTAENLTPGTRVNLVGPVSLSALAVRR